MRWIVLWVILIGLVLLPFLLFEQQFNAFAEQVTRTGTSRVVVASAIFGLLALDVFLPVPSSIVSTAAGVFLGFGAGATIVWLGMMAGCVLGYAVGARGSSAARRLVGDDGLARAEGLVRRYGDLTIVLCRPIPVLAEASVVFAGLVRAPYARFARLTAISNLGIALGYSAFGAYSLRMDSFLVAFLGALLLPGLFMLVSRYAFGAERGGRGHS
jgi:membrane protein DedA with SNARE-associated domain